MDVSSSQSPATDPQRNLFFGAEDLRIKNRPAGPEEKYLTIEKARRNQMAENVIATANNLANAVRTLRSFDRTGNAAHAIAHIVATFEDLQNHTFHLVEEVEGAAARLGVGPADIPEQDTVVAFVQVTPATVARSLR